MTVEKILPDLRRVQGIREEGEQRSKIDEVVKRVQEELRKCETIRSRAKGLSRPGVLQTLALWISSPICTVIGTVFLTIIGLQVTDKWNLSKDRNELKLSFTSRLEAINRIVTNPVPTNSIDRDLMFARLRANASGGREGVYVDPEFHFGLPVYMERFEHIYGLTNNIASAKLAAVELCDFLGDTNRMTTDLKELKLRVEVLMDYLERNFR